MVPARGGVVQAQVAVGTAAEEELFPANGDLADALACLAGFEQSWGHGVASCRVGGVFGTHPTVGRPRETKSSQGRVGSEDYTHPTMLRCFTILRLRRPLQRNSRLQSFLQGIRYVAPTDLRTSPSLQRFLQRLPPRRRRRRPGHRRRLRARCSIICTRSASSAVEWVLHTHHHRDQCWGTPRLREHGAKVAVPEYERHLFDQAELFWQNAPHLRQLQRPQHLLHHRPEHPRRCRARGLRDVHAGAATSSSSCRPRGTRSAPAP